MNCSKLFLLFIFGLSACSFKNEFLVTPIPSTNSSIIGGQAAFFSDAVTASTVSLVVGDSAGNFRTFCTGTLISKNLVMTAAHCLNDLKENFFVYFGTVLPKEGEEPHLVDVADWLSHPDYKYIFNEQHLAVTAHNDIALIKLYGDIPDFAQPVPIFEGTIGVPNNLLLAGYGWVNEIGVIKKSTGLNYARVPVVNLEASIIVVDQTNAVGSCHGDSGGPAYLETSRGLVVVGASRGPYARVKDCRHYAEYTNVTMFKTFILEHVEELSAEPPIFISEKN